MRQRNRGVALLTVLMVVALVALLAVEMSGRLQLNIKRQVNHQSMNQAYWYAMGAEVLAKNVLMQTRQDEPDSNHLQQLWAGEGMVFPVDNGTIAGRITDLQSCFNLNALQTKDANSNQQSYYTQSFLRLLNMLEQLNGPENEEGDTPYQEDEFVHQTVAYSLADWLDANSTTDSSYGAEDSEYESLEIPYLAANSPMASLTELIVVNGATVRLYNKLKESVGCVIPASGELKLNVNTVKAEHAILLAAMIPGLSSEDAGNVIRNRPEDGFKAIADFWASPEIKKMTNLKDSVKEHFVIKSHYFLLEGMATYNQSRFKLASVIHLNDADKASVIAREIGGAS